VYSLELLWVTVQLPPSTIFIGVAYNPLSRANDPDSFKLLTYSISVVLTRTKHHDMIILLGDFNLPSITWSPMYHTTHIVARIMALTILYALCSKYIFYNRIQFPRLYIFK